MSATFGAVCTRVQCLSGIAVAPRRLPTTSLRQQNAYLRSSVLFKKSVGSNVHRISASRDVIVCSTGASMEVSPSLVLNSLNCSILNIYRSIDWSKYVIDFGRHVMQNPFKYPRQMESLQGVLSKLPSAGVYVLGAALVAALGGVGSTGVGAVAPGEKRLDLWPFPLLKGKILSWSLTVSFLNIHGKLSFSFLNN